jgi:CYTH domain-containing protein
MALEIERRFLLQNDQWKEFITHKTFIEQGYLSYDLEDWIIRIRFNSKNFQIALKKHIKNFTNYEYEFSIPNSEGEKIMETLTNTIKKERFFLEVAQKEWIIDCFKDKNFPLEIAEIELTEEKEKVILPSFLAKEITGL